MIEQSRGSGTFYVAARILWNELTLREQFPEETFFLVKLFRLSFPLVRLAKKTQMVLGL